MKKSRIFIVLALVLSMALVFAVTAFAAMGTWNVPDYRALTGKSSYSNYHVTVTSSILTADGIYLQSGMTLTGPGVTGDRVFVNGSVGQIIVTHAFPVHFSYDDWPTGAACSHYAIVTDKNDVIHEYGGNTYLTF